MRTIDAIDSIFEKVMEGEKEAFSRLVTVLVMYTEVWLVDVLRYDPAVAEREADQFVGEVMIALAMEPVQMAVRSAGAEVWLKRRCRRRFLAGTSYSEDDPPPHGLNPSMASARARRVADATARLDAVSLELLQALISPNPQQALENVAFARNLSLTDVRARLSAAIKAVKDAADGW